VPEITRELLALRGQKGFQPYRAPSWANPKLPAKDGVGSVSHDAGDWNVFYLFLHGLDYAENRAKCPATAALIASLPGFYDHAFFSALAPGTHVTAHNGPTNKKLRVHVPLVVPGPGCLLRAGEQRAEFEAGRAVVFDDSFEHEAWNNRADRTRIVLIIDLWHPDLSAKEVKFLTFLQHATLRAEKGGCEQAPEDADNFFAILQLAKDIEPTAGSVWN
jgi:aspartate beta-hydroxylase